MSRKKNKSKTPILGGDASQAQLLALQIEQARKSNDKLDLEIADLRRPWYRRPVVIVPTTLAIAALITAFSQFAVSTIRKERAEFQVEQAQARYSELEQRNKALEKKVSESLDYIQHYVEAKQRGPDLIKNVQVAETTRSGTNDHDSTVMVIDELTCDNSDLRTVDTCASLAGYFSDPIHCPASQTCNDGVCTVGFCNAGVCDADEDSCNCPADCRTVAVLCGNGVCDVYAGEDCHSCPDDCRSRLTGPLNKQFCCGDDKSPKGASCSGSACNSRGWVCTDDPCFAFAMGVESR